MENVGLPVWCSVIDKLNMDHVGLEFMTLAITPFPWWKEMVVETKSIGHFCPIFVWFLLYVI